MQNHGDGMNYAPTSNKKLEKVVGPDEFQIAACGLDHGHIHGMLSALVDVGATLKWVWDTDEKKCEDVMKPYPNAKKAQNLEQVLEDKDIALVCSSCVPCDRAPLGIQVLKAGKDYFVDKAPLTSLEQLAEVKEVVEQTGKKYFSYYSERLHNESAMHATHLVQQGAIGRVLQVIGLGPHRLSKPTRPSWFFDKSKYAGIIADIGSHQAEQFLTFSGAKDARVTQARATNLNNPDKPGLEDFGEFNLIGDNGASGYFRMDWFTPDGLGVWGDGRSMILGTDGYIELRKYIDIAKDKQGDHVYLVNGSKEEHIPVSGKVGYSFFGGFIQDCLDRTEKEMTQEHVFKSVEICLKAQEIADK